MKDKTIIYIHRGRNQKSKEIGKLFTSQDYNFDYRGKSRFYLLLKALITSREIPVADTYFVEGGLCMNVAYFLKIIRARKSKIILMVPEPLFNPTQPAISRWWIKKLMKKVDGMIAISEMVKEHAKAFYCGPIEVAHHHITDIKRFLAVKNDRKSHRMVFVCERPKETGQIKGLDIAIEVFRHVKKSVPDAKLLLIGSGTEQLDYGMPDIQYLGFQKSEDIYKKCSIILAPARYDSFNIAVAEGACAGLIPLVSQNTGAKEFLEKVDPSLVIPHTKPEVYALRIVQLWKNPHTMISLSASLKKRASYFTPEHCLNEYKNAWKRFQKLQ